MQLLFIAHQNSYICMNVSTLDSEVYCNYTHAQSYPTGAGGSSSVSNGILLHLQYNTIVCCLQNTDCFIMGDVHHRLLVHLVGMEEEDIVSCPSGFLATYSSQSPQGTVQVIGKVNTQACDSLHPCKSPP